MQGAPSRPELAGAVPWRSRLWRKYAAVMVALCVTAIVGFGAAEMLTTLANAKIQADRLQRAQAGEAAQALRAALVNVDRHVAAVNELPWTPGWLGLDTRREEFARLLRLVPAAERIGYRNAAGQELLQVSRRDVDTVVRPPEALASAPSASDPSSAAPRVPPDTRVQYSADHDPVMDLALVDSHGGAAAGATTVRLSLRTLAREVRPALSLPGSEVYAVDGAGVIALHREPLVMLSRERAPFDITLLQSATGASAPLPATSGKGRQGTEVLRSAVALPELGWWMVVESPSSVVMAPVWSTVRRIAIFLALGVALAMAAALWLAGRLTRPIRRMHRAVERLRAGQLDTTIEIRSGDELEDLATQFNAMAASLRASVTDLEERIAARTRDLERANRHKSEFLAHMSHELRTPLNAILGFADVLREGMAGPLSDEQREYIGDIHASGMHLLSLINDVLDLAKIEAGQLALVRADFDVAETVAGAAALVRQRCLAKGLSLATQLEPVANVWNADARRFKQILLNLLSNAVKFTPSGGRISLRGGLDPAEGLWIEVADNGIGIAEADHERVFQEFHQAGPSTDNPAEGRAEGTGLGLALVRRLVEQHGGRITLHSQLGEGACFRFNIPAATPRSAP